MSDRTILIVDGRRYEVKGDSVRGYWDATGRHISGPPEKISGDRVRGFHDWNGAPVRLREITDKKR